MIARGMQRMNSIPQVITADTRIRFDNLITTWTQPGTNVPAITYSQGLFTIPQTTLSDYLITWSLSFKTSDLLFAMKYDCLFDMDYRGSGFITEGCSGSLITTMGMLKGFKVLHVLSKTEADELDFSLQLTTSYDTAHLSTPTYPLPNGITPNEVANVTLSIISI